MIKLILSRAPLPLLALSAAWGVWVFQQLFTPWYVAALSAIAFEMVYIALSMESRPAAQPVAIAAVAVSVLYNVGAALFHLRPALLIDRPLWADVTLAVAHGLPLAVVAYAVSLLLLHTQHSIAMLPNASGAAITPDPVYSLDAIGSGLPACPHCGANLPSKQHAGAAARWGCSPTCGHRVALKTTEVTE